MIEITYSREQDTIKDLPHDVQEVIQGILQILYKEYGANRNKYEDNGGYVIVIEKEGDFEELKRNTYINCKEVIAEYVDKIVCSNGEIYTSSLILCNNNYAISLIIPLDLTPQNLKDYIVD